MVLFSWRTQLDRIFDVQKEAHNLMLLSMKNLDMDIAVWLEEEDVRERAMGEGCSSQFHLVCSFDPWGHFDLQEQNDFLLLH